MLPEPPPRRSSNFHWPARGRILTRFGRQSNGQTADGIEIQVDSEEPIVAADDGVVAFAGTGVSGYGYLVLIKHADDYFTAYGQNSAVNVARGDIVRHRLVDVLTDDVITETVLLPALPEVLDDLIRGADQSQR